MSRRVRRRRRRPPGRTPSLAELGLPEESPLTFEGRLELLSAMSSHELRVRDGRERPVTESSFAFGLGLILTALGAVLALAVVAYLLSS